jgi:hypothetical protein
MALVVFGQGAVHLMKGRIVPPRQYDGKTFRQELTTCLKTQPAIGARYEGDTSFSLAHGLRITSLPHWVSACNREWRPRRDSNARPPA